MTESDDPDDTGADSGSADETRPISVAELLARNGTIGAPPVGGRRRRRRGNSAAVTVAELTGEIPVIRDVPEVDETVDETVDEIVDETVDETAEVGVVTEEDVEDVADSDMVIVYSPAEDEDVEDDVEDDDVDEGVDEDVEPESTDDEEADEPDEAEVDETVASPPLSADPLPKRGGGPELAHDPRPVRRGVGAEQMVPDPVDQPVDLAGLVADHDSDVEELRSYLKSSGGTLFSGQSMADDLARRGIGSDSDAQDQPAIADAGMPALRPSGGRLGAVRPAAIALGQSALAVIFGAGLFIAFDQLWRWNNLVALVLSVLVILGLVVAVRVVRKTEDITSTLIAVAVGALVTLGPLALLQST